MEPNSATEWRARDQELRQRCERAIARATEVVAEAKAIVGSSEAARNRAGGRRATDVAALEREIAGLREAMASRAVIEQAKGIIMATSRCDADRAFELLAQQSQHTNRKLRDIAAEIVALQATIATDSGAGPSS